jgi:transposase InsO family protein
MSEGVKVSTRALERFRTVSAIRSCNLAGVPLAAAIAATLEACRRAGLREIPSERTCYRWLAAFEVGGLAALEPEPRPKRTTSAVLDAGIERFLEERKRIDPLVSIPEVLRLARLEGVIGNEARVSRTTLWRSAQRKELPCQRPRRTDDVRRFAYPNRMLMVLADGKHFRAGLERRKRVALVFLDDATRFVLGIRVATSENTIDFLCGLHEVIRQHGRFGFCFADHGPGFISDDTATVFGRLGIGLVHGTVRYPEGHGKIERFNRTMKAQLLRGLVGNPAIDDDPRALTLRLSHWASEIYNCSAHEGLDGDTPSGRWHADPRLLDFPADGWERHFRITLRRRVSSDNVVSVEGVDYEIPAGHSGRQIDVTRNVLDGGSVRTIHDGGPVRLAPVDLARNARDRRGSHGTEPDNEPTAVRTAAEAAWDRDYAPLTDDDGGYPDHEPDDDDET